MKRGSAIGALVLLATTATAAGVAEIRCGHLGMGGMRTVSTSHALRSYVGPTVVGVSTSGQTELRHGPVVCDALVVTASPPNAPSKGVRLHPNAPNPFNPSTTIRFDLPRDVTRVTLRVFDVSGRAVRTLVDGELPRGTRSVQWDGRDDAGRGVASGSYLLELVTPDRRLTRKMTLLK